ncbi:hypothetical protein MLD38_014017 [Melastoma candidum]|uniref:Uncharacterized protein n=1 Tax=Melastoma candidum TaxID=119954 RepID=A0ACB9RCR8_9MYRT|nr:hypothetical protein MLD38_014017 [Melastoma candidum]
MKLIKFKSLSLSPKRLFHRSRRSFPSSNHLDSSTTSSSSSASSASVLTRRDLDGLLDRLGAGACSQDEVEAMLRDVGLGVGDGTFEFFDEDWDGRITAEELLGVLGEVMGDEGCTLEDCRRMIAGVDGTSPG